MRYDNVESIIEAYYTIRLETYQKRKLLTTYISAMLTNLIVVFLTGLLGLLLFNTKKVADYFFPDQMVINLFYDEIFSKKS